MKPLKIMMSAFGPYPEKQIIDFSLLGERNFFLIHGPTGSGKTSILDAICFALYGETSGGERKTKNIRSDYADVKEPTEVTFEFSLGNKRFLIHRSPEQERPKKRGEGTTKQLSKAALWRINGEEENVLADRWSKVTEEVKNLLGFDVHQFRQVVILPQGQFRKLLLADSSDRQIILETLFQTGIYRKIEEALKEAAKKIRSEAEELLSRKAFILEQAEVETVEALIETVQELKARKGELAKQLDIKKEEEKKSQNRLDNARNSLLKLEEKERALVSYNNLLSLEKIIETKQLKLERGQKAEKIKGDEKNLMTRREDEKTAGDQLKTVEKQFIRLTKEKEKAEKKYAAEKENRTKTDQLKVDHDNLKKMVNKVVELETAKNNLNSAIEASNKTGDDVSLKKENVSELERELETKKAESEKARENGLKIESTTLLLEKQQKEYDDLLMFLAIEKKEKSAKKRYEASRKECETIETDYLNEKREFERVESAWIKGQAAVLSANLIDNEPCPVCGSTSHPDPAVPDEFSCDEKTLNEKRAGLKKSENRFNSEKEKNTELREIFNSLKTQRETLTGDTDTFSNKNRDDSEKNLRITRDNLEKYKRDVNRSLNLINEIETLNRTKEDKKNQLRKSEDLFIRLSKEKESAEAVYKERKKNIPEHVKNRSDIEKEISDIVNKIEMFEKTLKDAENKHELLIKKHAEAKGEVSAAVSIEKQTTQNVVEAETLFLKNLLNVGFADLNDYKNAVLQSSSIKELDDEIREYNENLKAAAERLKRAETAAKDHKKPDIDTIEQKVFEIKKEIEEVINTKSGIETLEKQKTDLHRQYGDVIKKSSSVEKEYSVTGRLSDVANGKNAHGMTFQRYVLATLLEDVLYSAGKQLKFMSRGRFNLLRSKERADMRSAGGLDLLVSDAYTGTTRPVNSLSGGESFLASLSLALGLADVVQSYAGGIKLDTIFVDEGFGSLDPETLDLAFKAFSDLQNTGRLVGIISHVPELKERITTRLEVVPGKRGSKAGFVL